MLCNEWDTKNIIPLVTFIPSDMHITKSDTLIAYNTIGNITLLNKNKYPENTVVVVRESERIDEDGYVLVNSEGIILPKEQRKTAKENYNLASNNELHTTKVNNEKLIKIVNTLEEVPSSLMIDEHTFEEQTLPSTLKTTNTDAPIYLWGYHSTTSNCIDLSWNSVLNATGYYIWKKTGGDWVKITSTTYPWYHDENLPTNILTYYRIEAYNQTGLSVFSNEFYIRAAERFDNTLEYVNDIYITQAKYQSIESLYDGGLELECRVLIAYSDELNEVSINNVFKRNGQCIKPNPNYGYPYQPQYIPNTGVWIDYALNLGQWSVRDMTSVINLSWHEYDGVQAVLTEKSVTVGIEAGANISSTEGKITAGINGKFSRSCTKKYTYKDVYNDLGSKIICYWEPVNQQYSLDGFVFTMGFLDGISGKSEMCAWYMDGSDGKKRTDYNWILTGSGISNQKWSVSGPLQIISGVSGLSVTIKSTNTIFPGYGVVTCNATKNGINYTYSKTVKINDCIDTSYDD